MNPGNVLHPSRTYEICSTGSVSLKSSNAEQLFATILSYLMYFSMASCNSLFPGSISSPARQTALAFSSLLIIR
jgi:hypothetical protein